MFKIAGAAIPACILGFCLAVATGASPAAGSQDGGKGLAAQIAAERFTGDLDAIRKRGVLRILVAYGRTDFFITKEGAPQGIQVAYADEYLKFLNQGVKQPVDRFRIKFIPTNFDRLLGDLEEGRGDIAAEMLTVTPERRQRVDFVGGGILQVDELVVVHKDVQGIEKPEDLAGRSVYVLKGSSYEEHLRELNGRFTERGLAPIRIRQANENLHADDILEMVNAGTVGITVVDDFQARLWAQVLADIRLLEQVKVSSDNTLSWAVRKNNPQLRQSLEGFMPKIRKGTLLGNMFIKRYYQNTRWIKNPISDAERKKLKSLLELFRKYAGRYDFDTFGVAAQAYQESRLNHRTRSRAGAVGIMQLLPSTAADPNVGIPDIRGLENNIHAGVKYLAFLRDRYFNEADVSAEDRLAFSWAAYNAGPANVRRMRETAAEMGLNPNVWFNNVELAAGKLVGRETVQYVRNIFKYYLAYSLVKDRILQLLNG